MIDEHETNDFMTLNEIFYIYDDNTQSQGLLFL